MSTSTKLFSPTTAPEETPSSQHFKSLSDYIIIEKLPADPSRRDRFRATEKVKTREANSLYDDIWFILMRDGLYGAEVEKALAELHQLFVGYATDIEIVKSDQNYYAASHGIRHCKKWSDCKFEVKDGSLHVVADNGTSKPIVGLGGLCVLARFFADNEAISVC